jgi:branched-chain amino acid transport system substrate-binding protein
MSIQFYFGRTQVSRSAAIIAAVWLTFVFGPAFADDISIGICQSTATGPAKFATSLWKGAELAVNEANAAGGVSGKQIKLVAMDIGNNDPAQARLSMKKAIDLNNIVSLLCWGTNVMVQNGPLIDEAKVLAFTMSQGTNVVKKSKYIQQLEGVTTLQCRVAAAEVKKNYPNVKRFATLYVNYEYGRELRDKCKEEFQKIGVKVVGAEAHPKSPPDLRAQLTKLLQQKPDAIYLGSIGGGTVALAIRTGRELGYKGLFITHGAGDTPDVYNLKLAENNFFFVSHAVPDSAPAEVKEATKAYGGYASAGYDFAWINGMLMKDLAKEGKPITGANLTQKLRQLRQVKTPVNDFVFLADGNTVRPMAVFTISNGGRQLGRIIGADELK